MTLLDETEEFFGTRNLYEVLNETKGASETEIKKAYRKASLLIHPDRVEESEKEKATKKFQVLSKVHYILSDKDKRTLYDDHGIVDTEGDLQSERDWQDYWRLLFPKISQKDIENFMEKYVGSEEEINDLMTVYERYKGDMDKICQCYISYDEERTTEQINKLIQEGKVKTYDKFLKEPAKNKARRQKMFEKEAKGAAKAEKELKRKKESADNVEGFDELTAMIQKRRQASFEDMVSGLEAKYCKKSSNKGTKRKRQ